MLLFRKHDDCEHQQSCAKCFDPDALCHCCSSTQSCLDVEWTWEYDADEVGGETSTTDLGYEEEDSADGIEVSREGECKRDLSN